MILLCESLGSGSQSEYELLCHISLSSDYCVTFQLSKLILPTAKDFHTSSTLCAPILLMASQWRFLLLAVNSSSLTTMLLPKGPNAK